MKHIPLHIETPLIESIPILRRTGRSVFLKMECIQPAASFKIRGIGRLCQHFVNQGTTHLISSSGGNAGYAVAYAGRNLGVAVTVIVPKTTPELVRDKIASEGATVHVHGSVWDESHAYALELCNTVAGAYIPPFDHPTIWEGHATLIDELAHQCPKPGAMVLSVGGGGLFCGVVEGLKKHHWHDVPVIAVETEGAASFARSIEAGELVTLDSIDSIATTLGAKRVAAKALELADCHPVTPVTVTDEDALRACRLFADDHRLLVEPACGAALSTIYTMHSLLQSQHTLVVIVCGGIGITVEKLHEWEHAFGH